MGTVFGLLGGTTSSILGFIVPGALGIQITHQLVENTNHNYSHYELRKINYTSWLLVVGGVIVGVVTTCVTLYDTFFPDTGTGNSNSNSTNSTWIYGQY